MQFSFGIGGADMKRKSVILGSMTLLISIAGCAAPSARISTGLQRYGLDQSRADCVGDRLQARLTLGQLQRLGKAAAAYRNGDTTPGVLTVSDLIRVATELRDPAIAVEVGTAAVGCGVLP
jgi:hypothetical protein